MNRYLLEMYSVFCNKENSNPIQIYWCGNTYSYVVAVGDLHQCSLLVIFQLIFYN